MSAVLAQITRPMPPDDLAYADAHGTFVRARDVEEWIFDAFLQEGSPLFHKEHEHLREARIGVLWSNIPVSRKGIAIAGTASMPKPHPALSAYDRQALLWFMRQFFGIDPLDFLITLDAPYSASCTDVNFLALTKHELVHCDQARDEDGELRFTKKEFKPIFCMRGHDVEEQISVVRDFGAVGRNVKAFIKAARGKPRIAQADIDWACGICLSMAA